jgi:hypothetical protein
MNLSNFKIKWLARLAANAKADVRITINPTHTTLRSTCVRKNGQTVTRIFTNNAGYQVLKREIDRVAKHSSTLHLTSIPAGGGGDVELLSCTTHSGDTSHVTASR